MAEERLQKLLARTGHGSRRHIEDLIREGRVTVNGQVALLGAKADADRDHVKVDGRRVALAALEPRYLLLHKPPAVMSTVEDPEGRPTVMDLVPPALRKGLFPVGRLDFGTTGLMLLTNDGDFALRIAHPRYGCTKTYEVKVKGRPEEARLDRLRRGISIDRKKTAPAIIEPRPLPRGVGSKDHSWWTVVLNEGRTRQIREMFLRIGHPVQKLRRVAIGPLSDPHLPPGACRELTAQEVASLLRPRPKRPRKAKEGAPGGASGTARRSGGPDPRSSGSPPRSGGKAARSGGKAARSGGKPPRSGGPAPRSRKAGKTATQKRSMRGAGRNESLAGNSPKGPARPPRGAAPGGDRSRSPASPARGRAGRGPGGGKASKAPGRSSRSGPGGRKPSGGRRRT